MGFYALQGESCAQTPDYCLNATYNQNDVSFAQSDGWLIRFAGLQVWRFAGFVKYEF